MELTSKKEPLLQIISVDEDRIDAAAALQFKDKMRMLTEGDTVPVVLDLGRVGFIDSSGLGAIVAVMKFLAPDRKLILAGLTPTVERVFKLTRMDSVFTVHPRLEDALAEVQGKEA